MPYYAMEAALEERAKALFLRVDPILRLLLAAIQRYHELDDDGDDNNNGRVALEGRGDGEQLAVEEKLIGLLKSQIQILEVLQRTLKDLQSVHDETSSVALGAIADYFLLPIQAILNSYNSRVRHLARQSQLWRCQETAANVLTLLLEVCPRNTVPAEKMSHLIATGTLALANTTFSVEGGPAEVHRLDRGEEHAKALMRCLQALLRRSDGDALEEDQGGNLMAQVVMPCINVITPPPQLDRQDPELVLEALNTLYTLMEVASSQDRWRSLFPGCSVCLLRRSLAREKASRVTARSVELLAQLLSVTMKSGDVHQTDIVEQLRDLTLSDEKQVDCFVLECNKRLPAPLTILLNMLPTSKSAVVRRSTITLCEALLMDTWTTWNDEKNLENQVVQCCVICLNDNDAAVRQAAQKLLDSFKTTARWNAYSGELLSSVVTIICGLPTFVRSKRAEELQSQLKLVKGYLELFIDHENVVLGGAIMVTSGTNVVLSSLASVFDVDFESIQAVPRVASLTQSEYTSMRPMHARYRFIHDNSIVLAEDLVKTLGKALGSKKACLVIDACITELHASCVSRKVWGFAGSSHASWVHEWIGITTVANQLLKGLADTTDSSGKEQRRTRKRIKTMASAVLSLVTNSPLWNLPTVFGAGQSPPGQGNVHISAYALRGNTAMQCSMLTFMTSLVDFLGSDTSELLPVLLYPLFKKLGQHNHTQVQSAALSVIKNVAKVTSGGSLPLLISSNFDYLFGDIQSNLRLFMRTDFEGDQGLGNFPSVAKAILSSGLKHTTGENKVTMQRLSAVRNNVHLTIKTSNDITGLFDRQVADIGKSQNAEPILDLIEFYEGSLLHLLDSFGLAPDDLEEDAISSASTTESWLDLLKPFRGQEHTSETENTGTDMATSEEETKNNMDVTPNELRYLSSVLARCGHLISHSSLIVRVASCSVQTLAYNMLGFLSRNFVKDEDDDSSENPSNAIYRQIHGSWPIIVSRLESLSLEFADNQKSKVLSLHVSKALPSKDNSSNVSFLARLFDLVGAISSASGSFMWRRLNDEVWPICARLLKVFLNQRLQISEKAMNSDTSLAERDKLLLSMLCFYKTVFSNLELGQLASRTISTIGAMVIPFIGDRTIIGEASMDALKSMLSVDGDSLWCALLSSAGRGLPRSPHEYQQSVSIIAPNTQLVARYQHMEGSLLQSRAHELLDFSDNLPEQSLGDAVHYR